MTTAVMERRTLEPSRKRISPDSLRLWQQEVAEFKAHLAHRRASNYKEWAVGCDHCATEQEVQERTRAAHSSEREDCVWCGSHRGVHKGVCSSCWLFGHEGPRPERGE